jgi:hypothetical protein
MAVLVRTALSLLAFLVLSCAGLRAQFVRLWMDEDQRGNRVLASFDASVGVLKVQRNGGPCNTLPLELTGVRGLGRIDAGVDADVFLLWGAGAGASGYLTLVSEVAGVFGAPVSAWAGNGTPTGAGYSRRLGELVCFDDDADQLYSATFSAESMSLGPFVTAAVDTSALPGAERALLSVCDDEVDGQVVAVLVSEVSIGPQRKLVLQGSGVTSPTSIEPYGGSMYRICRDVVVGRGVVHAHGQPGMVLEAFCMDTQQSFGVGVVGSDGLVDIAASGVTTGACVSVREFLVGGAGAGIRRAYRLVGAGASGPSGLTPRPFGGNSAATLVAGSENFRVLCYADAPLTAPAQWVGAVVLDLPGTVACSPNLGWAMAGAEALTLPARLSRTGGSVLGMVLLPIPANALGLEMCLQWMAIDGSAVASSAVACMRVFADG